MAVKAVDRPGDLPSSNPANRTSRKRDRATAAGPEDHDVTMSQAPTAEPVAPLRGSGRRAASKPVRKRPAERAPELAPLALDELRTYRQALITEESRVSYWRRILQARLDLALVDQAALGRLREVLGEHQASSRRLAMQPLDGAADVPPLPDLTALWETEHGAGDSDAHVARLVTAEQELSAYRRSLHARLDAATGELISRYRADPSLALTALPLPRQRECGVA
jgi:hypothetical protein